MEMYCKILSALFLVTFLYTTRAAEFNLTFPDEFLFASATAAYQVEGAWDVDGKGPSIWDHFTHSHPDRIDESANGDDAAKSYYKYKEDVKALKNMGMDVYRFSISWPRILPTGLPDNVNDKGLEYYNNLIDELLQNGITPMITIYHWDLPQNLQNLGGWTNEIIVKYFEIYANILFEHFGDKVKWWITINEPQLIIMGYEAPSLAPGVNTFGVGPYLVAHNILKAHARVYHLYNKHYRAKQNGKLSLALSTMFGIPLDPSSESDKEAVETFMLFQTELFTHPIFSKEGDYPQKLKDRLRNISLEQGFIESRLPEFTSEEVEFIRGTADFIAVNEYTGLLITKNKKPQKPSFLGDAGVSMYSSRDWNQAQITQWESTAPFTIRKVLNWFKDQYGEDWELFITENGVGDEGGTNDTMRVNYLGGYLAEVLKAIYLDSCKVIGYTVWALLDNFQWSEGYESKFGLYDVDFKDPERRRTPKLSAKFMKNVTSTRKIPEKYLRIDHDFNEMIRNVSLRGNLQRLFSVENS